MSKRVFLVAVAAVATLGVGMAAAHTVHFKSKVTIEDMGAPPVCKRGCLSATGTVRSPHDACEAHRKVTVFRKDPPGNPSDFKWSGESDADGNWEIKVTFVSVGDYYAKVKKRNIGPEGHKHICDRARSADYYLAP